MITDDPDAATDDGSPTTPTRPPTTRTGRGRGTPSRPPRSPTERLFNPLVVERTVVDGFTVGIVGSAAFRWLIQSGWAEPAARNALHRFEDTTAVAGGRQDPRRCDVRPAPQGVFQTGQVLPELWALFAGLALSLAVVMKRHALRWRLRRR